jgi:hypothetical protein
MLIAAMATKKMKRSQGHRACDIAAQTAVAAETIGQSEWGVTLQLRQTQQEDLLENAGAQEQVQLGSQIRQSGLAPLGQPDLQKHRSDSEGK